MNHSNKQVVKVALITGAAKRIGAAITKSLHQRGFKVAIHCHHSKKEAQDLANNLNLAQQDSAIVLSADLMKKEAPFELINQVIGWGGRLDLLVNNASVFIKNDLKMLDDLDWDNLFVTNVKAPFKLSMEAYPHLSLQKGSIINITDIHGEKPLKDYSLYCQTKAALVMQTKALAREFAPNVRVNGVAPGAIAWPEGENALSLEKQQKIIAKTPLQRHGDPAFIAQAIINLIENPFITGQILAVDGGRGLI